MTRSLASRIAKLERVHPARVDPADCPGDGTATIVNPPPQPWSHGSPEPPPYDPVKHAPKCRLCGEPHLIEIVEVTWGYSPTGEVVAED
jgi:hypothetical protein